MEIFYYAQLDENKIVIGVSQLTSEVDSPDMILIPEYDTELLGREYRDGEFVTEGRGRRAEGREALEAVAADPLAEMENRIVERVSEVVKGLIEAGT